MIMQTITVRWRPSLPNAGIASALALAGTLGASGAVAAPRWTIQVDPLTTALGFVHVQVEHVVAPHWSVYLGPSLKLFGGLLAEEDDVDYIGLGAELGVRYYFGGGAPHGGWALVRGVLAHLETDGPPEASGLGGYVSALGGYTWILDERWVFSLGLGVQYLAYTIANAGTEGVLPAAHTTVGIAF